MPRSLLAITTLLKMPSKKKPNTNRRKKNQRRPTASRAVVPGAAVSSVASPGAHTLVSREVWQTVTGTAAGKMESFAFTPGQTGMNTLDNLGKAYALYRVKSVRLEFDGLGPTTSATVFTIAPDFETINGPTTEANLTKYTPNITMPAYRKASMVLPVQPMKRVNWFETNIVPSEGIKGQNYSSAFVLYIWTQGGTDKLRVICSYDLEFCAPSPGGS